jgi:DNA-binding protein H-NS
VCKSDNHQNVSNSHILIKNRDRRCDRNHEWGTVMANDFEALTTDELYLLHLEITAVLKEKLAAKKHLLEQQLHRLHPLDNHEITQARRPYPPVKAKFRNPDQPSETWSGRGKRPRWLDKHLRSGKRIDDFRILRIAS